MLISSRGRSSTYGNISQGVFTETRTSTSYSSPMVPAAISSRAAATYGANRSWVLTAATSPLRRQTSRVRVPAARSFPSGFCSSTAAPSGSASSTATCASGGRATS